MRRRCTKRQRPEWQHYGRRGIRVCNEWMNDFPAFFAHVGPRPSLEHSIDRIDNDRGYEPGNVRWATPKEQGRNKRVNRLVTHDGETLTVPEWSERTGVGRSTIRERLKHGWSVSNALTKKPAPRAPRTRAHPSR